MGFGLLGVERERGDAEVEGTQVLLLVDSRDHLLEIVGCDMPLLATAATAERILSLDLSAGDVEGIGGGAVVVDRAIDRAEATREIWYFAAESFSIP
jgi:hypothetical protein